MKRFSERACNKGLRPARGYLAKCPKCGLEVVFAASTGAPMHMHRYSKKCAELAAKRREKKS